MLFQPLFRPQRGTVSNFQGSEKIPKRPVGLEFDEPSNDKKQMCWSTLGTTSVAAWILCPLATNEKPYPFSMQLFRSGSFF